MGLELYLSLISPPCMSVRVLAKNLNLDLTLKELDFSKDEHKKPEFIKINPQHTVPTLADGNFILWESRAILQYLCDKYANDNPLYPKDPKIRAVINRLLFFDLGSVYTNIFSYFAYSRDPKPGDEEKKTKFESTLATMEEALSGTKWFTGNEPTIADISLLVTTMCLNLVHFDFSPYPNIKKWMETGRKELVGFDIIEEGIRNLGVHVQKTYMTPKTLPEEVPNEIE